VSSSVAPGASYEATLELGISGLVGTLEVATYDGDTATQSFTSTGINEIGVSGVYVATLTAPDDRGQYVLIWSQDGTLDPDLVSTEDLRVTSSTGEPFTGDLYGTEDELFRLLKISNPTAAQTDAATRVLTMATGEIDAELDREDTDPISGWEISLVTEVALERAVELWRETPFGIVGIDSDIGGTHTARNTWERYAHKLAPAKRQWGLA
jgi:hypothetical protein